MAVMKAIKEQDSMAVMQRNAEKAEALLKLLANARRLMILCHLVKGEKTVGELEELIDLSQSALSQHLAKLREHSVVECEKRGQMVYYNISNPEVEAMLGTLYLMYCKQ